MAGSVIVYVLNYAIRLQWVPISNKQIQEKNMQKIIKIGCIVLVLSLQPFMIAMHALKKQTAPMNISYWRLEKKPFPKRPIVDNTESFLLAGLAYGLWPQVTLSNMIKLFHLSLLSECKVNNEMQHQIVSH